MKKSIYTLVLLSAFLLSGCNDWLELLPPQSLVQDEYWKTKEDVESVLMAAYKKSAELDEYWFMAGEVRADMVEVLREQSNYWNTGRVLPLSYGQILPSNKLFDWSRYYEIIKYCNFVLEFAPSAQKNDATFTEYQLAGYEAESYFLRSWVYFQLVKTYGRVPYVTSAPKTDNQDFYLPVSSEDSVLNAITNDLLTARLNVTDEYGSLESNKGRASKAAIDALLADIYLWREDYENCIKHIDYIDPAKYLLMPSNVWFENFYPGNSLESIMEFQLGSVAGIGNSLYGYTMGSSRMYYPSLDAIIMFHGTQTEPSEEYFRALGSIDERVGYIWKYGGSAPDNTSKRSGSEQTAANWILYRVADVQLMKAEALIELGRYSEAFDIVNTIRLRVELPKITDIPTSKNSAEDLLLEERAKELAFEGKRWWDLMRMGRRNNFERKEDFIKIVIEGLPVSEQMVLANRLLDPDGWYWPIYDGELDRNKNLEQNPYYAPLSEDRN